jgi:hypothetical protein
MADKNLRATQAQLCDALGACAELKALYRRLPEMFLEELQPDRAANPPTRPGAG